MNKNIENYKKAINKITPSDELKENTFKKTLPKPKMRKPIFIKYIATCAIFAICFSIGAIYLQNKNSQNLTNKVEQTETIAIKNDLPRFKDMEQLKEVLKENQSNTRLYDKDLVTEDTAINATEETQKEASEEYSKTNVQVQGVDEADLVKTDGNYIYYITKSKVYIIETKGLQIKSTIENQEEKKGFNPSELYINQNKLIVIGTGYESQESKKSYENEDTIQYDSIRNYTRRFTKAIIYNISDKTQPKVEREIEIDGYYNTSRMIEENIYIITSKPTYSYYSDEEIGDEILPKINDSLAQKEKTIDCTEIAYFEGTDSNSFMTIAGFNINNKEEIKTECIYGASNTIYSSSKNLYITQVEYKYSFGIDTSKSTIYKFNLEDSNIKLQAKTEIKGNLNNQFSMDEYNGNLRIATTSGYDESSENQLYILDENLNEIGKIENLAKGEKIYSVRFIGETGYIVTFEQIDPLFVIDLSNPKKPEVKGELKIPGYSSYLHPYDETHIIGIGYNTKSNGYGGVTNDNMKMSMFDISDLENPKELFSIDIGNGYTYSSIDYNHKILFYNQKENLIGLPVNYKENGEYTDKFELFKINLEKGFEKYGSLKDDIEEYQNIERAIYINKELYILSTETIAKYNLETLEKEEKLELEEH